MKEVKVTMYEAKDGRLFNTPANCIKYEKNLTENMKAKQKFNDLIDFCKERVKTEMDFYTTVCTNTECPFWCEAYAHNCLFGLIPYGGMNKLEI